MSGIASATFWQDRTRRAQIASALYLAFDGDRWYLTDVKADEAGTFIVDTDDRLLVTDAIVSGQRIVKLGASRALLLAVPDQP